MKEQRTLDINRRSDVFNLSFVADTIQVINFTPEMVYLRIGDNVEAGPTSYHNMIPPVTAVTLPVNTRTFSAAIGPVYAGAYVEPYTERVDIIWTAHEFANNATQFNLSGLTIPQPIPLTDQTYTAPFAVTLPAFTARSRWLRLHWRYQNTVPAPTGYALVQVSFRAPGGMVAGSSANIVLSRASLSGVVSNFSDIYVRPGDQIEVDLSDLLCPPGETWEIALWYEFINEPAVIFPRAYKMCHRADNFYLAGGALIKPFETTTLSSLLASTGHIAKSVSFTVESVTARIDSVLLQFKEYVSGLPLAEFAFAPTNGVLWAPASQFSTIDAVTAAGHLQAGYMGIVGGMFKRGTAAPFTVKVVRPLDFTAPSGVYIDWTTFTASNINKLDFTYEYECPL